MKKWMQRLVDQFDFDFGGENDTNEAGDKKFNLSEDTATLLFFIDTYNKALFDLNEHPIRKTRETLDQFAQEMVTASPEDRDRVFFKFRQFFSAYRMAEYTYVQKTLDEFRSIVWDFVDQLSEDFRHARIEDEDVNANLEVLKDAVESNSIEQLRSQSRHFIDSYIEYQSRRETRRSARMQGIKKNLNVVQQQLSDANNSMRRDHLTNAFNRKCFDEYIQQQRSISGIDGKPLSLIALDIDHFKKFNDTYGHAIGDFVLIECVKLLERAFSKEGEFVARTGGEEFAVVLPHCSEELAVHKAQQALEIIRREVFVLEDMKISFRVSMGVAQFDQRETVEEWMKRADDALYAAKTAGRDQLQTAKPYSQIKAA